MEKFMRPSLKLLISVFSILIVSGCAVGNKHNYSDSAPNIKGTLGNKLGLGTQDQRVYVISGDKSAAFVGLSRGGFGNPFNVETESGKPLADDITNAVSRALSKKGVQVTEISIPLQMDQADVVKKLTQSGNKAVFISIKEWKSDTYQNTALNYNIQVQVIDMSGKVIAQKSISGNDNLGGDFINPPGHAKRVIPPAFQAKLELLFSDPAIASHL
jgi:hypothetical protein